MQSCHFTTENVEVSDATKYRSEDLITEIEEDAIHPRENPPACLVSWNKGDKAFKEHEFTLSVMFSLTSTL